MSNKKRTPGCIFPDDAMKGVKIEWPAVIGGLEFMFNIPVGSISTIARINTDLSVQVTGRSFHPSSYPSTCDVSGFEFEMNSVDPMRIRNAIEKNAGRITQVIEMIRSGEQPLATQAECISVDLEVGLALLEHSRDPTY